MKKILILGGSHRDIPLIKASQNLGFYVITLGNKDYYLGHRYSDKAYKINFNDLSEVRRIIIKEKVNFLLPGCGEESYLNTVTLSNELKIGNFDSLEVAKLIHNKWRFKEFCLKHNISTPKGFFYDKNAKLDILKFPIVVKPTNLSGGRGVEVVSSFKDLTKALEEAKSLSNEIFLEEFIDGKLIAYSIFIENQKVKYEFFAEDKVYLNKYLISTAYPTDVSAAVKNRLKSDLEKLASELKLVNGMFHLQVLIKDNIPYIIDVTRRIPGDLFPYLIQFNDNVDYSKAVVNAYTIGNITDEFQDIKRDSFVIRHCVMPNKNGVYQDLYFDPMLKDKIINRFDLVKEGYIIENFLHTQVSIVFIKLEKHDNMVLNNINELIFPIIKESLDAK